MLIVEVKDANGEPAFVNLGTMAHYQRVNSELATKHNPKPVGVITFPSPQEGESSCDFFIYNEEDHQRILNKLRKASKGEL